MIARESPNNTTAAVVIEKRRAGTSMRPNPYRDLVLEGAYIAKDRALAELLLLAAIAPLGAWGITLCTQHKITGNEFHELDLFTIFMAMVLMKRRKVLAEDFIQHAAVLARDGLINVDLWDDSDTRPTGDGMRWGPERLAHLFYGMQPMDAERALPVLAKDLRVRDARQVEFVQ